MIADYSLKNSLSWAIALLSVDAMEMSLKDNPN